MQYGRLNLNSQNKLSASIFVKEKTYEKKFKKIVELCLYAHSIMREKEKNIDGEQEETLRSILKHYMETNRGLFKLGNYHFDAESAEINENYTTEGYCDIKVTIPTNNIWSCKAEKYFTLECKRLDGTSAKNNKYIEDGMHRFITEKYSKNMNIGGMIGFIETNKNKKEPIDIDNIVTNINTILITKHNHLPEEKLNVVSIDTNHYSCESVHAITNNNRKIQLVHLFLDNRPGPKRKFNRRIFV